MALNCANWTDKQLDELSDMLRSSDYSAVAAFIAENFLCVGSRIMTDPTSTTLRVTVNGTDGRAVDLSAGTFLHNGLVAEVDSAQTINILNTAIGTWGTGQAPGANPRWSIICVKQNELLHTPANRWFTDDTVVPNTYYEASVNTLINKAYYDIIVVHGAEAAIPIVPATPAGYWCIAEIYVEDAGTSIVILPANIYDTASVAGSQAVVPNWTSTSRVLRLEFWSTLFNVDHDPATGYHRAGAWHIGATTVVTTGTELNQALHLIGATVTAANLTKLTDSSVLTYGELHTHGASPNVQNVYDASAFALSASFVDITGMELTFVTTQPQSFVLLYSGAFSGGDIWFRFTLNGVALNPITGFNFNSGLLTPHGAAIDVPAGTNVFKVQARRDINPTTVSNHLFTVIKY